MALYAIGDVQGCFAALQALLKKLEFKPRKDYLWFTGDLVNRGPQSCATLRFVRDLDDRAVTVLGNHDLHLLAVAANQAPLGQQDNLNDVLEALDRDELLAWLRRRPLLHYDANSQLTLVHAGLLPQWDLPQARMLAREVETVLRGPGYETFLGQMYGNTPNCWRQDLKDMERLRVIINAFTRLRYCDNEGRMDLNQKGPPGSQPAHLRPWFEIPGRKSAEDKVVFGHWSTLPVGLKNNTIALDSGCLWGGTLTAVRLDRGQFHFLHVPCKPSLQPQHPQYL